MIEFHFSFFAAVSLMMIIAPNGLAIWGLTACIIHELGHLFAMIIMGQRADKIVFYGAGIKIIKKNYNSRTSFDKEIFILISGVLLNFIVFLALAPLDGNFRLFGIINLIIAMFNLLPLKSFDGGKLITTLFYKFFDYSRAITFDNYLQKINLFLSIAAIIIFYIFGYRNFTFYLTILYLLITELVSSE